MLVLCLVGGGGVGGTLYRGFVHRTGEVVGPPGAGDNHHYGCCNRLCRAVVDRLCRDFVDRLYKVVGGAHRWYNQRRVAG